MTTTAPPLLPEVRPSFYDRWLARLAADPALARRWQWIAPVVVTVVAGILRFWNLGHPHTLVFDETYYVKDAWTQWNLGFPSTWPDDANPRFEAGETGIFQTAGSFVVHPPLGKWLIGVGMWAFGPESSFGWRASAALFGTALVLVLYLVAKLLTGSVPFATVASGLLAIDGLAISMSRLGILDVFLAFFVMVAFWFVLLDRRVHLPRLEAALAARSAGTDASGRIPVFWNRPWLVGAGLAAGAATAVKWSGLYVIVALAVYVVVTDALARRRSGIAPWHVDALRQGLAAGVLALPAALAVYLASWSGWLLTDGGYDRHAVDANPATGIWGWVPLALQNLWRYHEAIYAFHVGLTGGHPYASPAWQWPFLIRPTAMFFRSEAGGTSGCQAANGCVQDIYSMPNPLIWYAGVAAVVYIAYRFAVTRDGRLAFVLTGVAATYVPWLLYPERTIFQFYTVVILPFMVLALAFGLQAIASAPAHADAVRRLSGQRVVIVYLAFVLALSALWYPLVTATTVPYDFWRLHNWTRSWI